MLICSFRLALSHSPEFWKWRTVSDHKPDMLVSLFFNKNSHQLEVNFFKYSKDYNQGRDFLIQFTVFQTFWSIEVFEKSTVHPYTRILLWDWWPDRKTTGMRIFKRMKWISVCRSLLWVYVTCSYSKLLVNYIFWQVTK